MKTSRDITAEIIALCNYAEFTQNGKFNIIGVYDQQNIDAANNIWPGGFVVFTLKTPWKNKTRTVRLQIVNDENVYILNSVVTMNIGNNGKANFLFGFSSLTVPSYGTFHIRLTDPNDDEAFIGETDVTFFQVTKGETNGQKKLSS